MTQPRFREPFPLGGEDGLPYSKGLMARALIAVGVSVERAYLLARRVEKELQDGHSVDRERLNVLAVEILGEPEGARAVDRLHRYHDLRKLDIPIIVLVGGATGSGKSTVATEVAHRLGITRVTSTDFVRQTMRAFFSKEFMPSVHHSSFEVGSALPPAEQEAGDALLVGFIDQTRNVLVGIQAAIDRALEEGWSMVLEGVHLVPGMLERPRGRALVVHCVLSIDDETTHASHFFIRDADSEGVRPVSKYLARLADIRRVQKFIVDEARKASVPVVQNSTVEQAITEVMELVLERAQILQPA
jgi:2-phosphoglycerate kinase